MQQHGTTIHLVTFLYFLLYAVWKNRGLAKLSGKNKHTSKRREKKIPFKDSILTPLHSHKFNV